MLQCQQVNIVLPVKPNAGNSAQNATASAKQTYLPVRLVLHNKS